MSGVAESLERYKDARQTPTLDLLDQKYAHTVLAVFDEAFSDENPQVSTDRFHDIVDQQLADLADQGYVEDDLPPERGRNLCRFWVSRQWLRRVPTDDGGEAYELTSFTHEARRIINDLARRTITISDTRIAMILSEARKLAISVDPDPDKAIRLIEEQIAILSAQAEQIRNGDLAPASDDEALVGFINLQNLLGQIPGDFERVREDIDQMRRDMIADFRRDERPKGEILGDYLERAGQLASQTRHGRAFESALSILNDREQLAGFRGDLRTIAAHPAFDTLRVDEQREFLRAEAMIRRGLESAMRQRHKATQSLREHLTSHDSSEERELDEVLRGLEDELNIWSQAARARSYVPMEWMPGRISTEHLFTRYYNPANDVPPEAVDDVRDQAPPEIDLAEVRRRGGPLLNEVREQLTDLLRSRGDMTLGEAFGLLPNDLRRPVEVFALLQVVTNTGGLADADQLEAIDTIRPDGSLKQFDIPVTDLTPQRVGHPLEGKPR